MRQSRLARVAAAVAMEIMIARIAVLKAYGAKALTIPDGPSLGVSQIGMPRKWYVVTHDGRYASSTIVSVSGRPERHTSTCICRVNPIHAR